MQLNSVPLQYSLYINALTQHSLLFLQLPTYLVFLKIPTETAYNSKININNGWKNAINNVIVSAEHLVRYYRMSADDSMRHHRMSAE
jgi:hypothetical protein